MATPLGSIPPEGHPGGYRHPPQGGASPEDLLEKFYPPGFGRDPFLKDMSNFNKWCKRERGTIAQATNRYVLYDAEVVGPYRRQPKVTSSPAST